MPLCSININVDFVRIYIRNNSSATVAKSLYFAAPNSTVDIPLTFESAEHNPVIASTGTVSNDTLTINTASADITVTLTDGVLVSITNSSDYVSIASSYLTPINTTATIPFEYVSGGTADKIIVTGGTISDNSIVVTVGQEPMTVSITNAIQINVSVDNRANYHVLNTFNTQSIFAGETAVFDLELAQGFSESDLISTRGYIENSKLYVPTTASDTSDIQVQLYRVATKTFELTNTPSSSDSTNHTPFNCSGNDNSLTQLIYSSGTINNYDNKFTSGDIINKIAFKKYSGDEQDIILDIYMKNTNKSSYGSYTSDKTGISVSSTDKVFSGTVHIPAENDVWIEIPLDNTLTKTGPYTNGNLAITTYVHSGQNLSATRVAAKQQQTGSYKGAVYSSSSSTINPESYTSYDYNEQKMPSLKVWVQSKISPDTPDE